MIEITAKLPHRSVFLAGETIECLVTVANVIHSAAHHKGNGSIGASTGWAVLAAARSKAKNSMHVIRIYDYTRVIPKVCDLNILDNNIFHNLYVSERYILCWLVWVSCGYDVVV